MADSHDSDDEDFTDYLLRVCRVGFSKAQSATLHPSSFTSSHPATLPASSTSMELSSLQESLKCDEECCSPALDPSYGLYDYGFYVDGSAPGSSLAQCNGSLDVDGSAPESSSLAQCSLAAVEGETQNNCVDLGASSSSGIGPAPCSLQASNQLLQQCPDGVSNCYVELSGSRQEVAQACLEHVRELARSSFPDCHFCIGVTRDPSYRFHNRRFGYRLHSSGRALVALRKCISAYEDQQKKKNFKR